MSDSEGSSSHHIHASKATQSNTSFPATIRAVKDSSAISEHQRTLVVCLDGTGDRFDADNSNVVHFVSCLKKHAPDQQVTYYQSGIGTYDEGGLQNGIGAALDMAVGSGLGNHIKDAYRFLMQHYREGDKVCLLGFSRGAYTVRCLAGMLHKVGLLPAGNIAQINFAYAFYKDDSPNGWKMSAQFKYTFCTDLDVYFVGVWDCVSSVGFIPRTLPFSHSPTNSIHYFRHAIALDEHRAKFDVSHWGSQDPDVKKTDATNGTSRPGLLQGIERLENNEDDAQARFEAHFEALEASKGPAVETDVLEVWFMGAHADVGGGSVGNDVRHQLSRIPLRWMFRQCFECNTGILFDTASLVDFGLDIHTLYPTYHPPTQPDCAPPPALLDKYKKNQVPPLRWRRALFSIGGATADQEVAKDDPETHHLHLLCEATEDHFDARAPVNDQLAKSRTWWILEFWPVNLWVLATSGVDWVKRIGFNLGRHRAVRVKEPRMHWTVQHMVDEGKYQVKARTHREAAWKVVT